MHELPHYYTAKVDAHPSGSLNAFTGHLSVLKVDAPKQFGGPGIAWSPEKLLMAAAANCFVLSFRTVAELAKLEWLSIECETEGELDKVERSLVFTKLTTSVRLLVADPSTKAKAEMLLRKAEKICLVSNSLTAVKQLNITVIDA